MAQQPEPVQPKPGPAGYAIKMIRPHLRDIPHVPFPDGFQIRTLRVEEGDLWTEIVRDAEPYLTIADDLFEREFGDDLPAVPQRCFLIVDERDAGVGTISAWYVRDYRGQAYGLVHWVAIRPAYQGIGLGKAGLSFALARMAEWHERAMLSTHSKRLPALRMYLNFGFLPDLEQEGAAAMWEGVREQLHHPSLEWALGARGKEA